MLIPLGEGLGIIVSTVRWPPNGEKFDVYQIKM